MCDTMPDISVEMILYAERAHKQFGIECDSRSLKASDNKF